MKLSGKQLENLEKALIDAFPDKASLERMLWYRLDKNLNQVAGDRDLATVVFNLIKVANAEGWIKDLVCEASQYNPGNLLLKAIATELLADNPTPSTSNNTKTQNEPNSSKEYAIAQYRKKVEEFLADDGEISFVESEILKSLQSELKLTEEEARAVRDEVLKPLGIYQENLDKYRQIFTKLVDEQGDPLLPKNQVELKKLQEYYQLKNKDIALLENVAEQQQAEKIQQQEDDLSSDRGVDYTKLRDFLKAGQWKKADEETFVLMLKAALREKELCLDYESIENFPCTDLRTIDKLWVNYSNGRFGFSVQKRIWESFGRDNDKFGDAIGWRKMKKWLWRLDSIWQVTFDTSAPEGHLPVAAGRGVDYSQSSDENGRLLPQNWWVSSFGTHSELLCLRIFSRVETCKV